MQIIPHINPDGHLCYRYDPTHIQIYNCENLYQYLLIQHQLKLTFQIQRTNWICPTTRYLHVNFTVINYQDRFWNILVLTKLSFFFYVFRAMIGSSAPYTNQPTNGRLGYLLALNFLNSYIYFHHNLYRILDLIIFKLVNFLIQDFILRRIAFKY